MSIYFSGRSEKAELMGRTAKGWGVAHPPPSLTAPVTESFHNRRENGGDCFFPEFQFGLYVNEVGHCFVLLPGCFVDNSRRGVFGGIGRDTEGRGIRIQHAVDLDYKTVGGFDRCFSSKKGGVIYIVDVSCALLDVEDDWVPLHRSRSDDFDILGIGGW